LMTGPTRHLLHSHHCIVVVVVVVVVVAHLCDLPAMGL
jgi:hypothetical protein